MMYISLTSSVQCQISFEISISFELRADIELDCFLHIDLDLKIHRHLNAELPTVYYDRKGPITCLIFGECPYASMSS